MERTSETTINASSGEVRQRKFDLVDALANIWRDRILVAGFVSACTIIAAIVMALVPNLYTAETTILPETQSSRALGLSSVSDLAAAAGF